MEWLTSRQWHALTIVKRGRGWLGQGAFYVESLCTSCRDSSQSVDFNIYSSLLIVVIVIMIS